MDEFLELGIFEMNFYYPYKNDGEMELIVAVDRGTGKMCMNLYIFQKEVEWKEKKSSETN